MKLWKALHKMQAFISSRYIYHILYISGKVIICPCWFLFRQPINCGTHLEPEMMHELPADRVGGREGTSANRAEGKITQELCCWRLRWNRIVAACSGSLMGGHNEIPACNVKVVQTLNPKLFDRSWGSSTGEATHFLRCRALQWEFSPLTSKVNLLPCSQLQSFTY